MRVAAFDDLHGCRPVIEDDIGLLALIKVTKVDLNQTVRIINAFIAFLLKACQILATGDKAAGGQQLNEFPTLGL